MTTARPVHSPVGVAIMFATNGAVFSSVLPWYPLLKQQWGLTDLAFGFIVAAFAAGSLVSSVLPSLAVNRFGPRPVVFWGTVALALLVAGIGWASSGLVLAILLIGIGLFDAVVDVSQNVAGVRVESRVRRSILSAMHAFWSLGAVLGGIGGTAAASSGWDIRLHLAIVAVAVVVLVALAVWLTGPVPSAAGEAEADGGVERHGGGFGKIMLVALPVALLATSGTMVEDIANNWAGLSSVELADVDVADAGVAYTVVLTAQMVGRFTGDRLIDKFGRVAVARAGGVLIAVGGLGVVAASGPGLLYAGYVLVGFGCATLVPSAFAAAARLPGVTEGAGVTAVSWLMRVGFLATSPVLGSLSAATGLRRALLLLVLAGVVVAVLAPALRSRPARTPGT
ncbi:MFS transporter [Corynebacterium comes]|uniref:Inner membrane protein YbjJ n=1 Tax=Corynebacterium comes TaxID=2675218 RepID=A0A6B8WBP1_9CORY|nr:MFS transporter [Corynebacterium comes]QGU04258.1 Inner membrane protein YbjJ [Corynebacterium comes]